MLLLNMSNSQRSLIRSAIVIVALLGAGLVSVGSESDTSLQQRIDRLDTAVQTAEGVRAIKRLHYSYAHYLESGLWNDLADLFTQNAAGELPTGSVKGSENLRQ